MDVADNLITIIKKKSGLAEAEINLKVAQKQEELHGLLSRDGALHIIANELGIPVTEVYKRVMPIEKLVLGMRFFEIEGTVVKLYKLRKFDKNGRQGQVGSFLLRDSTGFVRVVLWDDKAQILASMHEGDQVTLQNARIQNDQQGNIELHTNSSTHITIHLPSAPQPRFLCKVSDIDSLISTYGSIVSVHDLRYFTQCPICRKRLAENNKEFCCVTHGLQKPHYGYLLSLMLDDGTATIRVVLFSRQVEQLIGMNESEIQELREDVTFINSLRKKLLGTNILLNCSVRKNQLFSRIELHAIDVKNPTPLEVTSYLDSLVSNAA